MHLTFVPAFGRPTYIGRPTSHSFGRPTSFGCPTSHLQEALGEYKEHAKICGRPSRFGRPTLHFVLGFHLVHRDCKINGRLSCFGHPTLRTSETIRTSDISHTLYAHWLKKVYNIDRRPLLFGRPNVIE